MRLLMVAALVAVAAGGCGPDGGAVGFTVDPTNPFDLPVVVREPGSVLAAPRVQPIYFAGFPYQTDMDTFLGKMAASTYWPTVVGEYGVGALTVLPGFASTATFPASISPEDAATKFADELTANAAILGPPRSDTIYVLFFSPDTQITLQGTVLCADGAPGGFHAQWPVGAPGSAIQVPLAMIPSCPTFFGDPSLSGVNALTPAVSHEVLEASTDPLPKTAPAYADVDALHAIWSAGFEGGELADLCENEIPNLAMPADIGFPVQRSWSNSAVAAGTGPCVPVPDGETYFTAVAALPYKATFHGSAVQIPAMRAPAGAAASVTVQLRAGMAAPASWDVVAIEDRDLANLPAQHMLPASGGVGAVLTIPVVAPSTVARGTFPLLIASHAGNAVHFWLGAIVRY